eukprot:m.57034 g.57034  ORF g.57034 m.57034 type:complete len:50 (-) comp13046_c0_seq2:1408-1557(-)
MMNGRSQYNTCATGAGLLVTLGAKNHLTPSHNQKRNVHTHLTVSRQMSC